MDSNRDGTAVSGHHHALLLHWHNKSSKAVGYDEVTQVYCSQ